MKAASVEEKLAQGMAQAVEVGDCLEWQGYMTNSGTHPTVKARLGRGYSENVSVPRLLWETVNGPIPSGKLVYRKCCNNACVLQEHLAVGTRKDLMRARKKAGATSLKPTTVIAITLSARKRAATVNTPDRARIVREMLAAGVPRKVVAIETGVSPAMVADIGSFRAWRDMSSPWAGLGAA